MSQAKIPRILQSSCSTFFNLDSYDHEYIIKCLEAGVDAVTEKPISIDSEKCRAILDAENKFSNNVTVAFNCRFIPCHAVVKEIIKEGLVGDIFNINYEHMVPGQGYFQRWHRRKINSGGLLVHKATHDFDLANWWLDDEPCEVMAYGATNYFRADRGRKGERCSNCKYSKGCSFAINIGKDNVHRKLYLECEKADGYIRDLCVFAEGADIEDTASVNVRYSSGTMLNFSLNACVPPFRASTASINGNKGRLEVAYTSGRLGDNGWHSIKLFDLKEKRITFDVPKISGKHGGGDDRMREMLFDENTPDPLGQTAGSYQGVLSAIVGIAANKSIELGRNIKIEELLPLELYRGYKQA